MKKGFTLFELLFSIAVVCILAVAIAAAAKADACGFWTPCEATTPKNDTKTSNEITSDIAKSIPVPQLTTSSERKNVARRAELFNNEDKISYIYLVSYGKVMAFYTVKGKVSSLQSYMTPVDKLIRGDGSNCTRNYTLDGLYEPCYTISAPDIDGTYGDNVEGIFFFTTEGAYVEWKGEYMMSDQPLKLSTQPELIREIK